MDIDTSRRINIAMQIYKMAKVDHFDISSLHVSALNKYIKRINLKKISSISRYCKYKKNQKKLL